MKRSLILAFLFVFAAVAFAAPPERPQQGGGGRALLPPGGLAEYLSLSDAQVTQARALRETVKSTIAPLRDQMRANREAMQTALAAGDTAKAGELALAARNIGQQMKDAQQSFETSFAAMLTPEQKAKWDAYQQILELRGRRPSGPRR
jgi:Spy/CpxP family protein refolding chaperone